MALTWCADQADAEYHIDEAGSAGFASRRTATVQDDQGAARRDVRPDGRRQGQGGDPRYLRPDFVMVSNGITQGYEAFRTGRGRSAPPGSRMRSSTTESWVEADDRVTVRLRITSSRPDEAPPASSSSHRDYREGGSTGSGAHLAELVGPARFRDYEA
jgi:hypothetical protein